MIDSKNRKPTEFTPNKDTKPMIELPNLPYAQDALEPHISAKTISFHYLKHHQGYVTNLNNLIANTPYADLRLEQIILESANKPQDAGIFNNAAQVWNHTFYWHSMKPQTPETNSGQLKDGPLKDAIVRDFGSVETLITQLKQAALTQFGSGWAWLVLGSDHKLSVEKTSNAHTPFAQGQKPLLTVDVWEHAYYLDFQNLRAAYLDAFFAHLLNWQFAEENFKAAL
jgi:Fe-Mn family superoxide dismutase